MDYDNPTTDSSPENLLTVCNALTNGSMSVEELAGDESVDLSRRVVQDTVRYGLRLGFLEGDDGALNLTDLGYEVAFDDELADSHNHAFREGVSKHPLYSAIIDEISNESSVDKRNAGQLEQKQILSLLNRKFGFQELSSESTLKPASNTFLSTLDAAGFGDYTVGRRGKPTRVEVNDDFMSYLSADADTGDVVDEEVESNQSEGQAKLFEEEIGSESIRPSADGSGPEKVNEDAEQRSVVSSDNDEELTHSIVSETSKADLTVEITISSEDWDSEQVIDLVKELRDS